MQAPAWPQVADWKVKATLPVPSAWNFWEWLDLSVCCPQGWAWGEPQGGAGLAFCPWLCGSPAQLGGSQILIE